MSKTKEEIVQELKPLLENYELYEATVYDVADYILGLLAKEKECHEHAHEA